MNVDLTSKQYLNLVTNAVLKNKVQSVNGTQYSYYIEPDNEVYAQNYEQSAFRNQSVNGDAADDIDYFSGTAWRYARTETSVTGYGIKQDKPNNDIYGAAHGERWYTPIEITARFENPTKVTRIETEYVCDGSYMRFEVISGNSSPFAAANLRTRNSLWSLWSQLSGKRVYENIARAVRESPSPPTIPNVNGKALPWSDIANLRTKTLAPYIVSSTNTTCVIRGNLLTESLLFMALYGVGTSSNYTASLETLKSAAIKLYADDLQVSEIKWSSGPGEPAYALPSNELMHVNATLNGGVLTAQLSSLIVNSYGNGRQLAQFDLVDETVSLAIGDTVTLRDILGRHIKNGARFLVYDITYKCGASERRTVKCMEVTNNG